VRARIESARRVRRGGAVGAATRGSERTFGWLEMTADGTSAERRPSFRSVVPSRGGTSTTSRSAKGSVGLHDVPTCGVVPREDDRDRRSVHSRLCRRVCREVVQSYSPKRSRRPAVARRSLSGIEDRLQPRPGHLRLQACTPWRKLAALENRGTRGTVVVRRWAAPRNDSSSWSTLPCCECRGGVRAPARRAPARDRARARSRDSGRNVAEELSIEEETAEPVASHRVAVGVGEAGTGLRHCSGRPACKPRRRGGSRPATRSDIRMRISQPVSSG